MVDRQHQMIHAALLQRTGDRRRIQPAAAPGRNKPATGFRFLRPEHAAAQTTALGRILEAMGERGKQANVVVLSDHGFAWNDAHVFEHMFTHPPGILFMAGPSIRAGAIPANAGVLDAGLIVLAQKAQHYEIAGYGSACTFANILGRPEDAKALHQTLDEECQADVEYTRLAKETINTVAAAP